DLDVLDAIAALIRWYTAEGRGRKMKVPTLAARPLLVFEGVRQMVEWRMGRRPPPGPCGGSKSPGPRPEPFPLDGALRCLKRIRLSVERWNGVGGRQGYLTFVREYVHEADTGWRAPD